MQWPTNGVQPIEAAVAAAIEDLQHRESVLAEREASLVKREERAARVDQVINALIRAIASRGFRGSAMSERLPFESPPVRARNAH